MKKVKINTNTFSAYVLHDLSVKDFNGFNVGQATVSVDRSYKPKDGDWNNKSVLVKIKVLGKACEYLKTKITKGSEIVFENCELDDCECWIDKEGNAKALPVYNVGKIQVLKDGENSNQPAEQEDDTMPF